jgi:thioredoxin reductase (NADPH)
MDDFGGSGTITGDNILISVGGRPTVPKIPGVLEYAITSDDLFSLPHAPGKTLCVGAGYIALECGGFLGNLGYDTTIAVRSVPLRVGPFDRQCVDKIVSLMEAQGR